MRVLLTGSHGLIGQALSESLKSDGHEVRRLVRSDPKPGEYLWSPSDGSIDTRAFDGIDAVVHLAGAGIGDRIWTKKYMEEIVRSRLEGTALIAETIANLNQRPAVLVSASAIGYYGSRSDEFLTEESGPGTGFVPDLVKNWEKATGPAREAGVRTVHIRSGIVLSNNGGFLGRLLLAFKLGLGASFGNGRQWLSWIHIVDEVRAIRFLIDRVDLSGPFNLTAPQPVRNRDFVRSLSSHLHRPALLRIPSFLFSLLPNGMGDELLGSQRVSSHKLASSGFDFRFPTLGETLDDVV